MIVATPAPAPAPPSAAGGVTAPPAAVVVFEPLPADEEAAPLAAELALEAVPSAAPAEREVLAATAADLVGFALPGADAAPLEASGAEEAAAAGASGAGAGAGAGAGSAGACVVKSQSLG